MQRSKRSFPTPSRWPSAAAGWTRIIPVWRVRRSNSNAEAAQLVIDQPGRAAIAGDMAAERYGLRMLARNIEDQADNKTRFLVIGRQNVGPVATTKRRCSSLHATNRVHCIGCWSRSTVMASA